MLELHGFAQSGNTYKVAFALRALGVPFETRHVDFMHGATRDPAWREQVNEMGEAPVLVDGARRLTQSGAILLELAQAHGRHGGDGADERYEVLRWILFDNHKFTSYFASYRFATAFGPAAPDPAVLAWLRARMDAAFGIVDKHLDGREWMVGRAPTMADFSLCGYLFYPVAESGYDWPRRFVHLAAWVERLRALPGWADPYDLLPGGRIAPKWVAPA